ARSLLGFVDTPVSEVGLTHEEHASTSSRRVDSGGSRLSASPGCLEPFEISPPERLAIRAQIVEIVPGVNAGAVPIGKMRLHGVAADRLQSQDVHVLLAGLQDFLSRSVAAHLG